MNKAITQETEIAKLCDMIELSCNDLKSVSDELNYAIKCYKHDDLSTLLNGIINRRSVT